MESVSMLQVFRSQGRGELVIARAGIPQRNEETLAVLVRGIDPQINIFGEGGSSVEDSGLSADEQVIDVASVKALEKVCDHAPPSDPEAARAFANCDAAVRAGSIVATPRL
jgi:hypothetical protein